MTLPTPVTTLRAEHARVLVWSRARQQKCGRLYVYRDALVRRPDYRGHRRGGGNVGGRRRRCDIRRVLHGCWRLDSTCRQAKQQWKKHQTIPHWMAPSAMSLAKRLILAKSCNLHAQPRELPCPRLAVRCADRRGHALPRLGQRTPRAHRAFWTNRGAAAGLPAAVVNNRRRACYRSTIRCTDWLADTGTRTDIMIA